MHKYTNENPIQAVKYITPELQTYGASGMTQSLTAHSDMEDAGGATQHVAVDGELKKLEN